MVAEGRRVAFALAALVAVGLLGVNRAHVRAAEPVAWEPASTWALLVGVLSWQDPKLSTFPTKGRVDRVLEQTLFDRGVPRDHVTFLEDDEATLEAIRKAFDTTLAAAGEGSTLILYYADHGSLEQKQVHFANYDFESGNFAQTAWGAPEIAARLKESWYRAEVLETKPESWKVRYQGFDASWDEWVPGARLRAPSPLPRKKGDLVEVDWKKTWWPATVLDVREDFAFIHYDGFGDEWDEWATAQRMRPRAAR